MSRIGKAANGRLVDAVLAMGAYGPAGITSANYREQLRPVDVANVDAQAAILAKHVSAADLADALWDDHKTLVSEGPDTYNLVFDSQEALTAAIQSFLDGGGR